MSLHQLKPAAGSTHKNKRIGRGEGSGRGGTSTRGHKGAQSRSGYSRKKGFEGGQMPLYRRLAQRGFSNHPFKKEVQIVNLEMIEKAYNEGEFVNVTSLAAKRLIKGKALVKILANGDLSKKLTFKVGAVSKAAKEKIEKAGGAVDVS